MGTPAAKTFKNDMLFSVLLFFVDLLLQGCNPLLEVVPCCLILALEFLQLLLQLVTLLSGSTHVCERKECTATKATLHAPLLPTSS